MGKIFDYYVAGKCTEDIDLSTFGLSGYLLQDQFVFCNEDKIYYAGEEQISHGLFDRLVAEGKVDFRRVTAEDFLDVATLQDYIEELKSRTNFEY